MTDARQRGNMFPNASQCAKRSGHFLKGQAAVLREPLKETRKQENKKTTLLVQNALSSTLSIILRK